MTIRDADIHGAWVGWFRAREGCPWVRLASGDSRDEALLNLQAALLQVRGGETAVLPAGRKPDRPPSVFGRRCL